MRVCVCARARVLGGAIIMLIKDRCIHCSSVHSSAGINRIMSLFVLVQTVCLVQLEQHNQKMSHHNQFICPRCPTESTVTARHHFAFKATSFSYNTIERWNHRS